LPSDEGKEYRLSQCPSCQTPLGPEHQTEPWIQQTAELPEKLIHVTEHRRYGDASGLSASGPSWTLAANKNALPGNLFKIVSWLNALARLILRFYPFQLEGV